MKILRLDYETFSSVDIKLGVSRYTSAPDFEILLIGYKYVIDGVRSETKCIDLTYEDMPAQLLADIFDPDVLKISYNAAFEIACTQAHFKRKVDRSQWQCTYVKSLQVGLPGTLDMCARALKLPIEKDSAGAALIRLFCIPQKPTAKNGQRKRIYAEDRPLEWDKFMLYCMKDVDVEDRIDERLSFFPFPSKERKLWALDQKINNRGVKVDVELAEAAVEMDAINSRYIFKDAQELTGLKNPKSPKQGKEWLYKVTGVKVESFNKNVIEEETKGITNPRALEYLELRKELTKTSITKFKSAIARVSPDGRLRDPLQFYGANRTGRWAGRGVQLHNLKKTDYKKEELDGLRKLMRARKYTALSAGYESVSDVLSQLTRTVFIAEKKHKFLVADFSAIEARVLAWLAGEEWRLTAFKNPKIDIYSASASKMFGIPLEKIDKSSPWRQKGKVAELALGYQGAVGALIRMGALKGKNALKEEELPALVGSWRRANRRIVSLWKTLQDAAFQCVKTGERVRTIKGIEFSISNDTMWIKLPSGRKLAYISPRLKVDAEGKLNISYKGVDQDTKQWGWEKTYGGKLTENIVQAIARDLLADAMLKVDDDGFDIVLHVHDEIIVEIVDRFATEVTLKTLCDIMCEPVEWAPDLYLRAEGFISDYYYKN
jgi:DNA polymerase bacteriophage-type